MAPPLRVGDLPMKVQNEIVAGTMREEIAEFEHLQGIRPRPSSACADAASAVPALSYVLT